MILYNVFLKFTHVYSNTHIIHIMTAEIISLSPPESNCNRDIYKQYQLA